MTDKALISDLTWRTLESQVAALPAVTFFEAPHEIPAMLRQTTRKTEDNIHVVSFAIIADNEKDLRDFAALCKKRKANVVSHEEKTAWVHNRSSISSLVDWWRDARRNGASKAGGEATATKSERDFWQKFSTISDRWHLPSVKPNRNVDLLTESRIKHRATFKRYLGYNREEWQRLSEPQRQRILKRKANAKPKI